MCVTKGVPTSTICATSLFHCSWGQVWSGGRCEAGAKLARQRQKWEIKPGAPEGRRFTGTQKSCALEGPRRPFPGQQPCPLKQRRGASGQTEEQQDNYRKFPETCFKQTHRKVFVFSFPRMCCQNFRYLRMSRSTSETENLELERGRLGGVCVCGGGLRATHQAAGSPSEGASGRGADGPPCPSLSFTEEVYKLDY